MIDSWFVRQCGGPLLAVVVLGRAVGGVPLGLVGAGEGDGAGVVVVGAAGVVDAAEGVDGAGEVVVLEEPHPAIRTVSATAAAM